MPEIIGRAKAVGVYKKKLKGGVRYYYSFMHQHNPFNSDGRLQA